MALSTQEENIINLSSMFNNYHPRLNFTMERSGNCLNFLDSNLHKKGRYFLYNWYHKPSFLAQYLNYFSCHPRCHKIGTIMGLIDRILLLSFPTFHEKNFSFIINILLTNGYPKIFALASIRKRLHTKFE